MPAPNRATPFGTIEAIPQRGLLLGNRGSIHRGDRRELARPWAVRRWITCALEFKGWRAPMWEPGRWTPLFFLDEPVAFAAGHRPCALCRRAAFDRFMDGWEGATGGRPRVDGPDGVDVRLHADRVEPSTRRQRTHRRRWTDLPDGAFAALDDGTAALVLGDRVVPWWPSADGYGPSRARPTTGRATVLTPSVVVDVLGTGYRPLVHPAALTA